MSILFYKRPVYVSKAQGPLDTATPEAYVDKANKCGAAIPPELSFERILGNKSEPPCSLQDLMNYMVYVTHDAENLQFYLWLADYYQRFQKATKAEKRLICKEIVTGTTHGNRRGADSKIAASSPTWHADEPIDATSNVKPFSPLMTEKALLFLGVGKEVDIGTLDSEDSSSASEWEEQQSRYSDTLNSMDLDETTYRESNAATALRWQAFASQPFRSEVNRIAFHYIAPGSPRELKLNDRDRALILYALQKTTHPSALTLVKRMLDTQLRNQTHPNFIRWSICNGNKPRTIFLRSFAIMNIIIGFIVAIVLTLSSQSRYWRIFAALEWWFGITNLIAAYRGLCVLLHRLHTRNIRPWESADGDHRSRHPQDNEEASLGDKTLKYEDTTSNWPVKMEVFGAANNYSGEPWVEKEEQKSLWKRISDRKVTVQPGGLSIIQNRIIRQAEAWALIITIPLTVGFVALPKGNLY